MLVTKGKTKTMTLVNKVGKEYEGFLYIDPDNKEVKVDFPKKNKTSKKTGILWLPVFLMKKITR